MYNCPKTAKINNTKAQGNTKGGHGSILYKHFVYQTVQVQELYKVLQWLECDLKPAI